VKPKEGIAKKVANLILDAFPAVTEPPSGLNAGLSFFNFPASNCKQVYFLEQ
jgi:hypothetical protein